MAVYGCPAAACGRCSPVTRVTHLSGPPRFHALPAAHAGHIPALHVVHIPPFWMPVQKFTLFIVKVYQNYLSLNKKLYPISTGFPLIWMLVQLFTLNCAVQNHYAVIMIRRIFSNIYFVLCHSGENAYSRQLCLFQSRVPLYRPWPWAMWVWSLMARPARHPSPALLATPSPVQWTPSPVCQTAPGAWIYLHVVSSVKHSVWLITFDGSIWQLWLLF